MKTKILFAALFIGSSMAANAQTLFVPGGTAGIGSAQTTQGIGIGNNTPGNPTYPGNRLSFNNLNDGSNGLDGITWWSPNPGLYGIFKTQGAWTAPNYQQLQLSWSTGIILNPGSDYGKSFVDIWGDLKVNNIYSQGRLSAYNIAVGGGSIDPSLALNVKGNSAFISRTGATTSSPLIRGTNDYSLATTPDYTWYNSDQTGIFHPAANVIGFSVWGVEKVRISDAGMAIGSTTIDANYPLSVNGRIRAKEIKVYTAWADFVFDKKYDLMSLKDVEAYINANSHLPELPSAREVEKEGVSLGEMQAKLLQKIEELTLHLIQQNKKIEKLEVENAILMKTVNNK
jgi:hypothetical protein